MTKKRKPTFAEVAKDIKDIKIQGARNIAGWALYAYLLKPTKASIRNLKNLRPTEPMLTNVLDRLEKGEDYNKILDHFFEAQEEINKFVFELIKDGDIIFTHCHSTNVGKALIYAKKKGKKFEIYNTETRPLYQGRKTAKELRAAGIKVTMFVDSALGIALSGEQGTKKVSKIFLGADALLKKGIVNKVGSEVIAQVAKNQKVSIYIIADSWKYSPKNLELEKRDFDEVWKKIPKKSKIKIQNPAFEFVPKKYIKKIVTEFGCLRYHKFLRVVKKN
ncbi:MAG: hypothetical protein U9Q99_01935 [Nanoarchaeota archaeon]|nr:hypothetical protein [Nanoarchaeota archaeon]